MADRTVSARWRALSLILIGLVAGTLLLGTAGAHVTTPNHLWKDHIRPKADRRYVNEKEVAWAVVNPGGTLARGHKAVSSEKFLGQTGRYVVFFKRNVSNCAYSAVLGDAEGSGFLPNLGVQGFISAAPRNQTPKAVFVWTTNTANTDTDLGFHLTVQC